MAYGQRAIVAQKKLLYRHLEDLIQYNTKNTNRMGWTRENVKQLVMDVATGAKSYRKAAMDEGISYNTVQVWKKNGWIYEAVEIGKELALDALDRKFSGVINKALSNLDERLTHGDVKTDRNGKQIVTPVSAKDNAIVASIAFDKRQLLRGEATSISEDKSTEDRLKDLASQFRRFTEEKVIEGESEVVKEN